MNDNVRRLDTRIAYGARCTWWDNVQKTARTPTSSLKSSGTQISCCPHCGGVLFEMENEGQWFASVDAHEAKGNPGYRNMVEWARGKCFRNYALMKEAYAAQLNRT